jgi:hypothetical protein
MHNQSEIDGANRLLRGLRDIDDLEPVTPTLAMPEAANDDVALLGSRARA